MFLLTYLMKISEKYLRLQPLAFTRQCKQEMSLKKTNGVRLKKEENITQGLVLVHKSYTDDRKLDKMNIVKWTAILANFVRK